MGDDADTPTEREMKDFQFRQMKKLRVFDPADDMPKERSSLLIVSNKFGLTFVGLSRTFKVYMTRDILSSNNADGNSNEIIEGISTLAEVTVELNLHHLALSCDELTLSVCGVCDEAKLSLTFYDVRTFMNKARPQKLPFATLQPAVPSGTLVQDLKWNPALPAMLAVSLSDGGMMTLEVTDGVKECAKLPASSGITCLCWSPKGKQVAAGKMNATVSQYTPLLEEKKVIQCPDFYNSEDLVKVLDVLWLKTFAFAVVYAAADRSLETPPELVFVSLPKKDEKTETKYLNFRETVYGSCTDRHHHYFLNYIEDWDLVFVASAASIEVSVIARQDEKIWELWNLEDSSRAELPVSESEEDTLPLGLAIDFTSQQEIYITDEKTLPPAPVLLMLSSEGLLCPFSLLNLNPGAKQLITPPTALNLPGERLPKPGSSVTQPPKTVPSISSAPPPQLKSVGLFSAAASTPAAAAASTASIAPFSFASTAPATSLSSGFTFSIPTTASTSAPSAFSLGASAPFGSGASSFSFAKPSSETPSAFSFSSPSIKPAVAATPALNLTPQSLPTASVPSAKSNLNDRLAAVEVPASTTPSFSFTPALTKAAVPNSSSLNTSALSTTKTPALIAPVHPVQTSSPAPVTQKAAPAVQARVQAPQAAAGVKSLEKQIQPKKETDPIMTAIMEEISHFQKELDDLKVRSSKADFKIGTNEQMKALRKESEELHIFTLQIKETTESVHGDIGSLKTTLLEGFAGAEEAKAQNELGRDKNYRQLLYKRPLDPRSEEQLKEIRRLYQYVMFAVEDVNDVLDVEWEKHLEKKKKQKHMVVPGREGLFTTLANNLYIINQQKNRLDKLVKELTFLRLYNKTTPLTIDNETATAAGLESELESLRDALLKAKLDTSPQKPRLKSPEVKVTPGKQSQLRNFLSKGQMPPVRSTAPANLSRSAFLSPKYDEDLDDVSSTSSLCQNLEPHIPPLELGEEEEELQNQLPPMNSILPSLSTPRHPAVVRTPSIQPGFGAIQSTPLTAKIQSLSGITFAMSPIASPVPAIRGNLSGADSTALATKTVKHGAPPNDRSTPVTITAQQAAATAALQRHMANQKSALLTESALKTVPQVVNVIDIKEKGTPTLLPNTSSSTSSDPTPILQQALATAKRNSNQGFQIVSTDPSAASQPSFVFGQPPKTDMSAISSSATEHGNQPFSFPSAFSSVSLGAGASQGKEKTEFTFGNGKLAFGQSEDEPFSFAPKSSSSTVVPATTAISLNVPAEAAIPTPSSSAFELQPPKTTGGETLGIFSGVRVGQGGEANNVPIKPAVSSFAFGDLSMAKAASQYSFKSILKASPNPTGTDLTKGDSSSLFKPPNSSTKLLFSVPTSTPAAPVFGLPDSAPETKSASDKPLLAEPPAESVNEAPESAKETAEAEPAGTVEAPALPLTSTAPKTSNPPSSIAASADALAVTTAAPSVQADSTTTANTGPVTSTAATPPEVEVSPFQTAGGDKPGSIFTQPSPAVTDSSSLAITPVINTVAAAATTPTISVANSSAATASLFGQPAETTTTTTAPAAQAATGFTATGFGASTETGFGKPVFGQVSGFGQPASNNGSSSGFSFGQSAFGVNSSSAATTGGGLFGAPTATNASSFSFGSTSANTASSTGSGLFGQSTAPGFGQSSGFGQGATFGSNTATSSSGFGFGQPSGFGCSTTAPVFGQQPNTGSVFGQPQASTGAGLFGSSSANQSSTSTGGGFFSGLGGKPSDEAANKNPFGATSSTGGFGQSALTGTNSLFGNPPAKPMGFGQSTFGEQKPTGTFSTGGASVASQGFGSFSTPTKPGGFGSAPVFGSPPAFGSSPSFGASASFGASPSFNANMGSSTGKVFGEGTAASNMGGFGFGSPSSTTSFGALANQNASTFGAIAQQGSGFGSQPNSFSGFGQQQPTGGFSGNTFGSSNQFAGWRC
ncbi:nuclear pore complex protein Nup214 [Synchiropus picturatus]